MTKTETTETPKVGQRITFVKVAPVSAPHVGRTVTVKAVLPNAIVTDGGIFHLHWGTRRNPGDLTYTLEA